MLTFSIRGIVADLDGTIDGEPFHPSIVLVVEADATFTRVIAPREVLQRFGDTVAVGCSLCVHGEVHRFPDRPAHVATELLRLETLH